MAGEHNGRSPGLPVLNVAGTRVGIRILAQGQQYVESAQLGGVLQSQRAPVNSASCTSQVHCSEFLVLY